MMRLRAFRPTSEKIRKIELHPTHPWLVTADDDDHVSVWNWDHRQVIYELRAGGVDYSRLVGAKLEKLAEGELEPRGKRAEALRGGSVKQVRFYDDDVIYWKLWNNRAAASETPVAVNIDSAPFSSPAPSTKGRHFLVVCCENKAVFLDLVTMCGRDVPKQDLDNKYLLWQVSNLSIPYVLVLFILVHILSISNDGPYVAFGGPDGVIRVLSLLTWKLARRYTGGHKGPVSCLMTFMASSSQGLLVSGGTDGLLVLWNADCRQDLRELVPKLSVKAHDGGVVAIELSRVAGAPPNLITIGADKTLAIWEASSFKEIRRIKPVSKLACHSVASWCHPRAPNLDILTCVKDSHIWAIEHPTHSALARPLCELSSLAPPQLLASHKKLRVYSMVAHSLQPHLVATGTNIGVFVCEFDAKSLPPVALLPSPPGSREHSAAYVVGRELKVLQFQLSNNPYPAPGSDSLLHERQEQLHVKQSKKNICTTVPHDFFSILSISSSGKYMSIVWPDIPYFSVYKVSNWSIVDSGSARFLAWDACRDRFALLECALPRKVPVISKGSSSRKAKEVAIAAAQAAALAAATAASSSSVQVRILLDDGTSNILMKSIGSRGEPVTGLYGGALLGISYRTCRRFSTSTNHSMPMHKSKSASSVSTVDDGERLSADALPHNFQLYSWETFQPIGGLLPQPEWTAWDQTVEYCAFAYQQYIVISSLRPQFRYLGDVAIPFATGAIWHRRQLFVATPTTVECVFVDAGIASIDLETRRKKEEMKVKEAQDKAVAEHGDLALITVDSQQVMPQERTTLRPPMLQVVRLASFQHTPSIPPFLTLPRRADNHTSDPKETEVKKVNEVAVGGGGVAVSTTRFPAEQKRPVGPIVVAGVKDGALWLIDRYMCVHAISLSHPGIRCRCLAAHGDAVSAVKWASRLGREHHDDLAQFMLGMGYATEALHFPGISKRLEFHLALQSNDLKRALQCLLTMSNSTDIGHKVLGLDLNDIMNLSSKKENVVDAVQGVAKFAKEFLDLIDAADATGQTDIAREALKRLAAAGSVKGALQGHELRGLALCLGNHGELTRLSNLVSSLIRIGSGREAAFAAAILGDNTLMEKAWHDTGMLAEAVLHAHAHGRPSLRSLVQEWNKTLQQNLEHKLPTKMDAAAAFLASLEESMITSLKDSAKKPPVEILPPGMASLYGPNQPALALHTLQKQVGNQLLLEGPTKTPTSGNQLLIEGPTTGNQLLLEGPTTTPTSSEPLPSTESDILKDSIMEASNTSDSLADSSVSAPTSEQPDSTNAKSDVEPRTSVPPVTESGDPNALESDGNTMENKERTSSTTRVPEQTEIESITSVPPASTSFPEPTGSPVVRSAGSQELKDQ
ncbi:hypothetical protein SASPL_131658 [Salvia splendens]|uniref:Transducin/WD40 repeat-like superfamily protein n=1 Tax=Salvia splendens TaxID=180675 RepID=A0A8X8X856_SALSN|nr:hypothetical protein SASPL_131658 [Salvia splendens]